MKKEMTQDIWIEKEMKKEKTQDPWNEIDEPLEPLEAIQPEEVPEITSVEDLRPTPEPRNVDYSIAGLKADFPSAKELEQFVFDETSVSLKLKGIDPEKKYELALAVLKNEAIDTKYISGANPYVDNTELIPEDPIKPIPRRDPRLPQEDPMNIFHDFNVPHPDSNMRQLDAKVICQFKKYKDGSVSYEILGPLEKHSVGEKLDKYGRSRPEKIVWIDPRTGEQAIRYADGQYTRMGQRLRTLMESKRVNKNSSIWSTWIDRDFTRFTQDAVGNPWIE